MSRRPRMFLAALLLGAARAESEALWYWPALDTPDLPETTQHLDALRKPVPENQTMVSVFSGHDAHLAVARAGRVLGVVELERRERRRYFHPGFVDDADGAWARALRDARRLAGVDVFDVGVYVAVPTAVFPAALASIARDWYAADHHASHASLAYYDALSRGYVWPLVLSYDGGGNDGFFAVFEPTGDLARPLRRLDASRRWERLNLGNGYALVAEQIPEVAKCAPRNRRDSPGVDAYCRNRTASQRDREHLAGPGKMNGYASLGTPTEHDVSLLTQNIRDALKISLRSLDVDYADIAASAQRAFEEIVADEIRGALELAGRRPDALAVAGGCALNVGAPARTARSPYPSRSRRRLQIVASASGRSIQRSRRPWTRPAISCSLDRASLTWMTYPVSRRIVAPRFLLTTTRWQIRWRSSSPRAQSWELRAAAASTARGPWATGASSQTRPLRVRKRGSTA